VAGRVLMVHYPGSLSTSGLNYLMYRVIGGEEVDEEVVVVVITG